jgi:tetratricopeptide (TPR) repeat protein
MKSNILTLILSCCLSVIYAQAILKGTITLKDSGKPLEGVAITAVGISNKAYTDRNGFFSLECKGLGVGDVLTLIAEKDNYVVVDKDALREVTLRKDPNRLFNFFMQEENKRKSDIEKATKVITDNANKNAKEEAKQFDDIKALIERKLQVASLNEIERKAYQDSIYKLNLRIADIYTKQESVIKQAAELAEQLTAFDVTKASTEAKQADSLFKAGQLEAAYNTLDEAKMKQRAKAAKELLEQTVNDYMQKGKLAEANGKYEAAARLYEEGVKLDSFNIENIWTLAYFLGQQNQTQKGIYYYEKALSLAKSEELVATFSMNLGNIYKTINNKPEAEKYYLKSLEIRERLSKSNAAQFEPYLATTAMNLGIFYTDNNRINEAIQILQKSLAIRQRLYKTYQATNLIGLAYCLNNLGFAYVKNKEIDKASEHIKQSQILKSDNSYVFRSWACYYAVKNEPQKAIDNLSIAADMGFDQSEWIEQEKSLDSIRTHLKYASILKKIVANKIRFQKP